MVFYAIWISWTPITKNIHIFFFINIQICPIKCLLYLKQTNNKNNTFPIATFAPEQIKGNDIGVRCGLMFYFVCSFFFMYICRLNLIWSKRWTSITRYTKPFYIWITFDGVFVLFLMFVFIIGVLFLYWSENNDRRKM